MPGSNTQISVVKSMLFGVCIALAIVLVGMFFNPFAYQASLNTNEKLSIVISFSVIPASCLAIAIARLAKHRFFSAQDIVGAGIAKDTAQAQLLQSLLQNTLEQAVLAFIVYCAWAVVMPSSFLSAIPMAALAFGLGRIYFFITYTKGAAARAIGFTLSFYPSILLLIIIIATLLWGLIN
ncbi:MAG: hypothetical protein COC19_05860 [SAR86 cluster bacterium]|uniref:MAPEG family protein n=1 Tax=SAR86 cluster bacterium TaxID=2030880 RepID=A0A2A4MKS8_9GAMM|nr:MAG: hypothetical protein COC19_05860 [SAR86 cluster bacterium]